MVKKRKPEKKRDEITVRSLLDAYSKAAQREEYFCAFEREVDKSIIMLENDNIDHDEFFFDTAKRVDGVKINSIDTILLHGGYENSPSGQIKHESTGLNDTRNYWVRNSKGDRLYKVNISLDCKIEPAIIIS